LNDNGAAPLPPDIVTKKFQQKGWFIGRDRRHDICPDCLVKHRRRTQKQEEPVATVIKPDFAAVENEPRKMDVDERRIIFAKLNDVWAGKDQGYVVPWTDASVARDLGVPAAWVVEIRSSMFGEAHDNQEIRDVLTRIEAVNAQVSLKIVEAAKLRAEATDLIVRANALNGSINELRRASEGMIAIATRIEKAVK